MHYILTFYYFLSFYPPLTPPILFCLLHSTRTPTLELSLLFHGTTLVTFHWLLPQTPIRPSYIVINKGVNLPIYLQYVLLQKTPFCLFIIVEREFIKVFPVRYYITHTYVHIHTYTLYSTLQFSTPYSQLFFKCPF